MGLDFKVTDFVHQNILALQLTVCRYHKVKKLFLLNFYEMDFDS